MSKKWTQKQIRALLFDFPAITVEKVGKAQLETSEGKAKAIGQLIGKHGGEFVEVNMRHAKWTLERVAPGSASARVSELIQLCKFLLLNQK